ncbi:MAG: 4'-phosphopantetheinyl transferase superfamily protein [Arenimonas sp.]|nr:4'-phosphopantetheinyl transferase superfamily protein [Arenimonas sp.]MBP7917314.1 4'-phosphopantetheinyl transferase superfamily protein [Arenimonas sp.]
MSTELNQAALQRHFGGVCGLPVFLAHRQGECGIEGLSFDETEKLSAMSSEKRRMEYILGRHALKEVLARIGRDPDTSSVAWPSTFCSLSHSEGHAVAVSSSGVAGIGIDLQLKKIPPFAMAERILSGQTLEYWQELPDPDKSKALQRFWTANEAVYKACPSPQPAYFRHYRLESPFSADGMASIDGTDYRFSVHSAELADGFISLAIRM